MFQKVTKESLLSIFDRNCDFSWHTLIFSFGKKWYNSLFITFKMQELYLQEGYKISKINN